MNSNDEINEALNSINSMEKELDRIINGYIEAKQELDKLKKVIQSIRTKEIYEIIQKRDILK